MTEKEAEIIVNILCTADKGCSLCSEELILLFLNIFPKYKILSEKIFNKHFPNGY